MLFDKHHVRLPAALLIDSSLAERKSSAKQKAPSWAIGGILADMMGLGKSLTMISAIASTLIHARETLHMSKVVTDNAGWLVPSSATLVVVTSTRELE
jgi:hypothetical protein